MKLLPCIDLDPQNNQWLKADVTTLGGPGSGNFGHAGRPGEVGGSASNPAAHAPGSTRGSRYFDRNMTLLTEKYAAKYDFPSDDIRVLDDERSFNIGGQSFKEAAHFSTGTGEIVFRRSTLENTEPRDIEQIFAHEVMHRDWNNVQQGLEAVVETGEYDFHIKELGDNLIEVEEILSTNADQLQDEDGVSSYSRAYWGQVPQAPKIVPSGDKDLPFLDDRTGQLYKINPSEEWYFDNVGTSAAGAVKRNRAINETLAEISARAAASTVRYGGKAYWAPSPLWTKLHEKVKETAKLWRLASE